MDRCNGYIRDSVELYESDECTGENLSRDIETIFRGFEKIPIVICQRHDIKPYLSNMELDLPPNLSAPNHVQIEPIPTMTDLIKECSVLLERQNLEQLKEMYMKNLKENQLDNVNLKFNNSQKVYLSEKKLQNHQANNHLILNSPKTQIQKRVSFSDTVIIHEVKEQQRCRKFPKIIEDCHSLKTHRKQIHKKHNKTCAVTDYKDSYFCDQCHEKFNTETDMLQHKWTHFLKSGVNEKYLKANITPEPKYTIHEKLPPLLQPKLILERVILPETKVEDTTNLTDVTNLNCNSDLKKPIIDPISKKTIISRHQCEKCGKYLSSNYCLTRHMVAVHGVRKSQDSEGVQCDVCEEIVWPKFQHNCIRMMSDTCVRPEYQYRTDQNVIQIDDDEDYMDCMDFDIPAPIVEITEYENVLVNGANGQLRVVNSVRNNMLNEPQYKIVVQEVPIEFE